MQRFAEWSSGSRGRQRQQDTSPHGIGQNAWKQWIPVVVWLGIIAFESTDLLSAEHTGKLLYSWVTYWFGNIDRASFSFWHHALRKTAHVLGYSILSYLWFRAWRATLPAGVSELWAFRWVALSFLSATAVAGLDEWHQAFIPSRTGSVRDVLLDSSAAGMAQLLLYITLRYKIAKRIPQRVADT